MRKFRYRIGIDPSFNNMGVAVYDKQESQLILKGGNMEACLNWLDENSFYFHNAVIVLEDPNLNSHFWGYGDLANAAKKLRAGSMGQAEFEQKLRIALSSAQDVGKSKASADYLKSVLPDGVPVILVNPTDRMRADTEKNKGKHVSYMVMPTKLNASQFDDYCKEQLGGFAIRSNEHTRDAATLVLKTNDLWLNSRVQLLQHG